LRIRLSTACTKEPARDAKTNHRCHLRIDRHVLQRVWAEMDYRFDDFRVTKGGHMQHLWSIKKKTWRVSLSSVGRTLQSFPPLKCNDFMKCVRELWKKKL
jgi:hypothetical protein